MVCEAHAGMAENISRVRDSQGELYSLLRSAADDSAKLSGRLIALEISNRDGFAAIASQLNEYERQNQTMMETVIKAINRQSTNRWTPKMVTTLLSVILGPSGIAAVIMIFSK